MSAKLTIEVQGGMKGKDINKEFKAEYRFSIEKEYKQIREIIYRKFKFHKEFTLLY
jgi:hypothetical protein